MPIYEYRCPSCGHDFERLQRMNAPSPACPACGAAETKRRVSLNSFRLTGSGWYATDYTPSGGSAPREGGAGGGEGGEAAPPSGAGTSEGVGGAPGEGGATPSGSDTGDASSK